MAAKYFVLAIALGCLALACAEPIRPRRKCADTPKEPSKRSPYECDPVEPEDPEPCDGVTCKPPGSDHNCPERPGNPDGTCPADKCDEATFLPDKDDDEIFFICSNGKPIQMCCPSGLKWNPSCNACR